MNQQEFDQIYPKNITPKQHEVLDLWLKGLKTKEIADKVHKEVTTINHCFAEIFTRFNLPEDERNRDHLTQLFIYHRPDLISDEHKLKLAEDIYGYKGLYLKHYVNRPPLEENIRQKIQNCFSLRIKGLKDTGKTYLLNKVIIPEATKLGYLTISLSLGIANTSKLNDDNDSKFFKWLCDSMLTELKSQLNSNESIEIIKQLETFDFDYSKTGQSEFKNCLQKILESIQPQKLLLALDDVDYIFEYKDVANGLGQILRYILDNKQGAYDSLCLVILHSTEEYAKLSINHSPFGSIGIPYILEDFTLKQIKKDLFYQYNLKWQDSDLDQLISLVGGHPFLIIKSFEDSNNYNITPSDLLQNAGTNGGIYASLFLQQLETLNLTENSFLKEKFKAVIMSETEIQLDGKSTFLLQSMGLIKVNGKYVSPRCQLYRKYFQEELSRND